MARPQPVKRQRVETIADRLSHARRLLGVTLKRDIKSADLARMAGVPASTVLRIENGDSEDPNEGTLQKLAGVLGVEAAWLRYGAKAATQIPVSEPGTGPEA